MIDSFDNLVDIPKLFIFMFVQDNHKWGGGGGEGGGEGTKNKMDNLRFIDEETIPLVQNEDMIIMVHQIQAG